MLGKTHIAVGCAIYFYIAQPTDFKSLFADIAISIIGSEVSDIDEANSKVRHVFSWLLVGIVLLAAAATFIKNQFELTLTLPTCISTSKNLFTLFLLVLLFGYFSHHRNAMHSILIDLILSGIIAVWILLFCCISITCFTGYLKSQVGTIILSAENRSQI